MKRVTLNFPIRVGGRARQAGETVDLPDATYRALQHRRRGGRPLFDLPAGSKPRSPEKRPTARAARRLEPSPSFDKSAPYVRAPEGTQELERGSRAVLAWEGNTAIQFRCPCDERLVYVTSPPHQIKFNADGVLQSLGGSCGYQENPERGRPQNWCHFTIHPDRIEMHDDAECPGAGRAAPEVHYGVVPGEREMPAVHRPDKINEPWKLDIGEYCFGRQSSAGVEYDVLYCRHPLARSMASLPLNARGKVGGATWNWDGNRDSPTLTPSIHHKVKGGWHGYLTAGQWVFHSISR